ncbi:MAG: MFS transporter [Coxiellaceae bacterium]|nr:MFS transporter [Coxiellaceae bacterium]
MKAKESRAVLSLGSIMAFRMLGLFMILPVFSSYVHTLPGATPTLIGFALGVYGLTQACLQIPFGTLSDKIGRKPVIAFGLVLFTIGSIIAALSHNIGGIIIGRAIQGGGAVGSTVLALAADLTRDEHRNKAMAFIGLTIGMSFMLAMILGPVVNHLYHLSGIFWLTAIMSVLGILMLFTLVPHPPELVVDENIEPTPRRLSDVLKNNQLLKLDACIGLQHAIFTCIFIAIPILLTHELKLSSDHQVWLYVVVLVLAFFCMLPFVIIAEKKRVMRPLFITAVLIIFICQLVMLMFVNSAIAISISLFLFFTAFTFLESCLPSWVSKVAPIRQKGSAMGIYSSSQFFGIFVGGTLGGVAYGHFGVYGVFILAAVLALAWLVISCCLDNPPYLSTMIFASSKPEENIMQQIQQMNGVNEVTWFDRENLLYVKVDKQKIDDTRLRKLTEQGSLDH